MALPRTLNRQATGPDLGVRRSSPASQSGIVSTVAAGVPAPLNDAVQPNSRESKLGSHNRSHRTESSLRTERKEAFTRYAAAMNDGIASLSDAELLVRFREHGDERAFAELYERHKSEIYTYCLRMMGGDRDKASDVFQEVFIKAFEKAEQFRSGTNVVGWIYMIARNMCLNAIRNERPCEKLEEQTRLESFDRSLAPEYNEEQHFLRRKLEEALQSLPVEFREPFILREFDGFSYREIATMTGTTLGMTKVRIYRAKQRMRELLSNELAM